MPPRRTPGASTPALVSASTPTVAVNGALAYALSDISIGAGMQHPHVGGSGSASSSSSSSSSSGCSSLSSLSLSSSSDSSASYTPSEASSATATATFAPGSGAGVPSSEFLDLDVNMDEEGMEVDGGGALRDGGDLVRSCLQVEIGARPTFERILTSRFLLGAGGW